MNTRTSSRLLAIIDKRIPRSAQQEAFVIWALCFGAIAVTWPISAPLSKVVATLGFLYLPVVAMNRRNEEYADYGLSTHRLRNDLKDFAIVSAIVFPIFVAGYVAFIYLWPHLPRSLVQMLTPYTAAPKFSFRLPDRFDEWIVDQIFVVALPEEFFYRGFIQTRLRDAWPEGRVIFGARLGRAFWVTQILFALGHLAIFAVWRLGVFFPSLIFGWMRERSGSVVGAALFHAASNLLIQVLDASFFA